MRSSRLPPAAKGLTLLLLLGGCSEEDTTAPPAPTVDPVETPTTQPVQTITGSAEYGATVQITGGQEVVLTEADPFTARFAAEVALIDDIPANATSVTTTLSILAIDLAGNESAPAVVEIVYGLTAGAAASIELDLTGDAADGTIEAGQDVTYEYEPLDLSGQPTDDQVLVIIDSAEATVFDDGFSGSGIIVGLTEAKSFTITARVTGSSTSTTAPLVVTEASGARLVTLALSLSRMGIGDTVSAVVQVSDLYGNEIDTDAVNLTLSIEPTDPATTDFYTQAGNDFTITESGVFKISAVFDDGLNPPGEDFEYVIVEAIPDLIPPSVWVDTINGYAVCPNGLLTDQADLSDCGTRITPAAGFRRGSPITIELGASDNQSLVEVSFEASAFGTSVAGAELIGAGEYVPGEELVVPFTFAVDPTWAGDVMIVAQAIDGKNNVDNSAPAYLPVALDIETGDRALDVLASGSFLAAVNDVTVRSDAGVFVASADAALPQIIRIDQGAQTFLDLFPLVPSYLAFDATGNLYTTIREDVGSATAPVALNDVWLTPPGGEPELFARDLGANFAPNGLATTDALAATGRWVYTGPVDDDYCLSIQIGPEPNPAVVPADSYVVQLSTTCANNACAGSGPLGGAGRIRDLCVTTTTDAAQQAVDLAAALNNPTVRNQTRVSAFASQSCGGGNCVVLVSDRAGTEVGDPGAPWPLPIALGSDDSNWSPQDIDGGVDDGVLYVASDLSAEYLYRVQTEPAATAGDLLGYSDLNSALGADFIHAELVERWPPGTTDRSLAPHLFLYALDRAGNTNSRIHAADVGRNVSWPITTGATTFARFPGGATTADRLYLPTGIVYVPWDPQGGDCLIVANQSYTAVPRPGELLAYVDIDDVTGGTLEGGLPLAIGFASIAGIALDQSDPDPAHWSLIVIDPVDEIVARLGRSIDPSDCF